MIGPGARRSNFSGFRGPSESDANLRSLISTICLVSLNFKAPPFILLYRSTTMQAQPTRNILLGGGLSALPTPLSGGIVVRLFPFKQDAIVDDIHNLNLL